jgi:transposase-like protein
MVFEHTHEYPSQRKAIESVAEKLDINRETLRVWVCRAEVDEGRRAPDGEAPIQPGGSNGPRHGPA